MSSQKKNNTPNRSTEAFVPIKAISNGAIILDNNEKVTGIKINPKNIFILDEDSQYRIIENLKTFYNSIDFEFWLIIADRPVDITLYLSHLQLLYNDITKPQIRKMILEDMEKGQFFINNNVVDTEYYLLFKEKNPELIDKKIRSLINNLANCEIISSQTTNEDLRIILDNFLNGGMKSEFRTVMSI